MHAVSKTIGGVFIKHDVAVPDTCHNPATLRDPKTGRWLLFHIGYGNPIGNCGSPGGCAGHPQSKLNPGNGFLHSAPAKHPEGPWTPLNLSHPSTWTPCNNPAPAFHPNGSLFVVCNHMQLTHASAWDAGDWAPQRSMGVTPPGSGGWEDPTLWFDRRGNWHVLYHVYKLKPFKDHDEAYSGHAFSVDGLQWTFSTVQPYSGTVRFTDGTSQTFATRERPHLIFADADVNRSTPIAVMTGVSPHVVGPSCDQCPEGACSQCKYAGWTYTQLEPFANFGGS